MEFIGHSPTSVYLSSVSRKQDKSNLPCIAALPAISKDIPQTCPPNYPNRRPLITLPYRPATFYSSAKLNTGVPLAQSQSDAGNADTYLSEICGIRVPPIYSAARNALYTRYTPKNWFESYQRLLHANDRAQKQSEALRYESERKIKEELDRTITNQNDATRKLEDRIDDINFWSNELGEEMDKIVKENNDLGRAKRIAEKLLAETENQLHVAQESLYNREKRQGIDLVHDDVEKSLISEIEAVKQGQNQLRSLVDKANIQNQLNRAAQHELEVDMGNKFMDQQLDETSHVMKNSSAGVHLYKGVENIDQCQSVPETWNEFSLSNLNRSRSERVNSRKLRESIASGVGDVSKVLADQWNAVNAALAQRIRELTDARNKIQKSLSNTIQEIIDAENEIQRIKRAIDDAQAYLTTATTRLNMRLRRPGIEHTCDPAQLQLKNEVRQINDTLDKLRSQLRCVEDALQNLLRLRSAKETELAVKNNSLFIDREKCFSLRSNWPGGPTASSAHAMPCPGRVTTTVGNELRNCSC